MPTLQSKNATKSFESPPPAKTAARTVFTGAPITAAALRSFGSTLIVAPHPDDESLACGGLIALLRRMDLRVDVLAISDGTGSHPNSRNFPRSRLRSIRTSEMLAALDCLGVAAANVTFFGCRDGAVPHPGDPGFDAMVAKTLDVLRRVQATTIVLPFRADEHVDHRATWHIVRAAASRLRPPLRMLEYPTWIGPQTQAALASRPSIWHLDVASVLPMKHRAIASHRSQFGKVVDDDPAGFRMTPRMLENFTRRNEGYFEFRDSYAAPHPE